MPLGHRTIKPKSNVNWLGIGITILILTIATLIMDTIVLPLIGG